MSYRVQVEPSGAVVEVRDGETLLAACLRSGVWLPYACMHGRCGTCKVTVRDGVVDHGAATEFALMEVEREEGKCLACCATPRSDVVLEADVEDEPDALHHPVGRHEARVAAVEAATPTIRRIRLELDGPGLAFQAGQYVQLELPGVEGPRAFSLASPPSEPRRLELHVRRVPGGKGSGYLHDQLRVGDVLPFSGPYGRFYVRRSLPGKALFLAGGSGLSSPRAMILDLLSSGDPREITLVHGVRTRSELYDVELFRELAARRAGFTYVAAVSDEPVAGDDWLAAGPVHEVARARLGGDFRAYKAYLCGPPPMIEACVRTLMQGRLFEKGIFAERFDSAADARGPRSPLFKTI